MNNYLWNSRVPFKHLKFSVKTNKNAIWGDYYKSISGAIKKGFTIAIIGPRGSGKTQIGVCLIKHCASRIQKPCYYVKARTLFDENKSIETFLNPHLLVIDNVEETIEKDNSQFINKILAD